ncbi:MAG TPA: hypothetical protein VFD92_08860 [Candidatus Binatia bacterium]|nr:hypothetical protein [Candidatus Binatia bacterium]
MADDRKRGAFLTVVAALFALLTLSNFTKALQYANNPTVGGIVIFGVRAEGVATNLLLGPLVGLVTGAYAYGLWRMKRWVLPLSVAYAFYVPVNLVLFWYRHTEATVPPVAGLLVYLAIALGGSIGTALHLAYHRGELPWTE